jgi:hypothetical protein
MVIMGVNNGSGEPFTPINDDPIIQFLYPGSQSTPIEGNGP